MRQIVKSVLSTISPRLSDRMSADRYLRTLPQSFVEHLGRLPDHALVLDVGANVGNVSLGLAQRGATVHAFEPNKEALKKLRSRADRFPNIVVHDAAAGTEDGQTVLYLHESTGIDDTDYSEASSLVASKPNVSTERVDIVKQIDLARFISELNDPIELIKIDIEGFEIQLVNHLLDRCDFNKIGRVYVETHEKKWPELLAPTAQLKGRVRETGLGSKFDFDWI